ncbi:MAG TPA: DUF2505 family protein [Myxococcota bacterium]|nr:DUF2505 family protein [Myxococcota bacterium]HRY95274.1 DUF2505 family protein [Myxococcota bacterium]HSA22187.1 DUF2505 family protein [Myxococcota bacterium]
MHFQVEHTIRIPFERYYDVVLSDDFLRWAGKKMKVAERSLVRNEESGGLLYRTVRTAWDVSERAQRFLKAPRFELEERLVLDRARHTYTWEYAPSVWANRFSARGSGRLEQAGAHVKRVVEGEITVRVFLLGGRFERKVAERMRAFVTRQGDSVEEYYRTQLAPQGAPAQG